MGYCARVHARNAVEYYWVNPADCDNNHPADSVTPVFVLSEKQI